MKALFPSAGELQGGEAGVGGWEEKHPHRSRRREDGRGEQGKGIAFEV